MRLFVSPFAPENVMVDGGSLRLIDFDDAGFGWHLFGLVTALFFLCDEDYFDSAEAALSKATESIGH